MKISNYFSSMSDEDRDQTFGACVPDLGGAVATSRDEMLIVA